jgi:lincosamide nucleotidyltransferase A/C/D/E
LNGLKFTARTPESADILMAQEFTLEDLIPYLDLFEELELDIWIDGGWGVDALLGEQTRPHEDLDFLIEKASSDRLVTAIREQGFIDVHTNDHTPWNFVMGTPDGKNFDFHVLERAADGDYTYGDPDNPIPLTAESIDCTGTIAGRSVRCPTPEFLIDSHTGYTIKETDIHDVTLLSEKFDLPLHPEQLAYLAEHPRS